MNVVVRTSVHILRFPIGSRDHLVKMCVRCSSYVPYRNVCSIAMTHAKFFL